MSDNKWEQITIDKRDYDELLEDQRFLEALRAAGVDNWDGYELAQEIIGD